MPRPIGDNILGSQGRLWIYNSESEEYSIKEGIPSLDSSQEVICRLALTSEGYLYHLNKKIAYDFTPPLKQFFIFGDHPTIVAVTNEDKLIKVNLKKKTYLTLAEKIAHLTDHVTDHKRENKTKRWRIEVFNSEGHHVRLVLNNRLNRVVEQEDRGYIGMDIKKSNAFLISTEGVFSDYGYSCDDKYVIPKIENTPPNIVSAYELNVTRYCILLLDSNGNLFSGYHDGYMNPKQFHPCTNRFIIEANQADPWVELIYCDEERYAGLVSMSGKISLISEDFSIKSTDLPTEIYATKPIMVKNARRISD